MLVIRKTLLDMALLTRLTEGLRSLRHSSGQIVPIDSEGIFARIAPSAARRAKVNPLPQQRTLWRSDEEESWSVAKGQTRLIRTAPAAPCDGRRPGHATARTRPGA